MKQAVKHAQATRDSKYSTTTHMHKIKSYLPKAFTVVFISPSGSNFVNTIATSAK